MPRFPRCVILFILLLPLPVLCFASGAAGKPHFYNPGHAYFQYTGRIDFSDPSRPKFWMPGVYIQAYFQGKHCKIFLKDELPGSVARNYVEIVIDTQAPFLVHILSYCDTIDIGNRLRAGSHTVMICKATESGRGYLQFLGLECDNLLPPALLPERKIEFIGNSITCGYGNEASAPCSTGKPDDHADAYRAYGSVAARALHAQWHLSAVSGIGMIHSCCKMPIVMPDVFDKMDMRDDSVSWDFNRYIPDVVTICLGENDGIQDSIDFCNAYVGFIRGIRGYYPNAKIICLSSPMANEKLKLVLNNYIAAIVNYLYEDGDQQVYLFFLNKRFVCGCYGHPSREEDAQLSAQLVPFIRKIMDW